MVPWPGQDHHANVLPITELLRSLTPMDGSALATSRDLTSMIDANRDYGPSPQRHGRRTNGFLLSRCLG
jgi:hypothetical protein